MIANARVLDNKLSICHWKVGDIIQTCCYRVSDTRRFDFPWFHTLENLIDNKTYIELEETITRSSVKAENLPFFQKEDVVDAATLDSSYVKLLKEYNDLAEGYERLQQHMDEETKFHQEQTSQNVAVMTDMQDTITQLRNQLAELKNSRPPSSAVRRAPEFFF